MAYLEEKTLDNQGEQKDKKTTFFSNNVKKETFTIDKTLETKSFRPLLCPAKIVVS